MSSKSNIVVVGGGTGTFVVLSGLKKFNVNLSVIVSMMDSGGSTGRLRDQLGVLPPGDLRQALVALSESSEIWRKLFTYRFENGDFSGHSFGNLFISALEKITGSNEEALKLASEILKVTGDVVPVTFSKSTLCAEYDDGSIVEGEDKIDVSYTKRPPIKYMYLMPEASINKTAKKVLQSADAIIFGPGDLYTSIIPNLLVNGVCDVISESKAKKIYVVNLMTKLGQTDDFTASKHLLEFDKYLGGGFLDYVIVNNRRPTAELLGWYKKSDNVHLVEDDLYDKKVIEAKIIRADILSDAIFVPSVADRLRRSLIRHDPEKLSKVIMNIIGN